MRLLFDKQELEDVGKPTREDLLWAAFTFPLFASLAGVCGYRLIRVAIGYDLTFSAFFDRTLSATGGGPSFAAGIVLYLAIFLIALAGLWWCAIQAQRWWYWRK